MIRISVITVCLNAENCIRETIQSILNQTSSNYEYIIKDGISTDGTMNIAKSFTSAFEKKGISYRIISKKDTGIYDAMNQAILEAKGEWINLMNAGDQLANNAVLERVVQSGCLEHADVVYGDRILRKGKQYLYQKARALEDMRYLFPFGHQSTLTHRSLFQSCQYATQYRINSDYKFYLQMYRDGKKFAYFPEAISIYDTSGISSNWEQTLSEVIRVLEEMPVRDEEAIRIKKQELEIRLRRRESVGNVCQSLKKLLPKKLLEKWKMEQYRKAGWKTEEEFFGKEKE